MPEEKPPGLLTNTPVITGRTIEVQGKQDSVQSPMMSPNTRKDQIKNQALQTLKGIAGTPGGTLSKFGKGGSPDKKQLPIKGDAVKEEETKADPKYDKNVQRANAQLKKMGI
jgi:hypothetical protein